jgi:uncharacterized protein (TIGR03435 family)
MRRWPACVLLLVIVAVGASILMHGQTPPASDQKAPAFEVASVKPNTSGENRIMIGIQPGGGFRAIGAPLRELIGLAYGIPQPLTSFMVGGPNWIDTDHFDIIAKADHDWQANANGPPADFPPMIQTLLADRFKLTVHHDRREMPIYALVAARADGVLGVQLHISTTDCAAVTAAARARGTVPAPPPPGERSPCGMRMFPGALAGGATSMTQLANAIGRFVGRTVVDRSGLTGVYDLDLKWTPENLPQRAAGTSPDQPITINGISIDPNGPSIFTALQEQLGLKLESTKGPVDVLVIDHVERPTPD